MEAAYLEPVGIAPPPDPYTHAIRAGDTLYVAGQVALDEQNRVVGIGDPKRQAEQVWNNLRLAVEAAGGRVTDIVKITVFLKGRPARRRGDRGAKADLRGRTVSDLYASSGCQPGDARASDGDRRHRDSPLNA